MTAALATPSALVAHRMDSLHTLGTDVSGSENAHAAMERAGLTGWNVRTVDTVLRDGTPVPGGRASLGDINGRRVIFGQVGSNYTPVQNEQFAPALDKLAGESGAEFSVGMSTLGGSRVLITMAMPEALSLGGVDPHTVQIAALLNHRTGANRISAIPFRAACANQNPQILDEGDELFVLRHTSGAEVKLDKAGEMIDSVHDYLANWRETSERMLAAPLATSEFLKIAAKLVPSSGVTQRSSTNFDNRMALLRRMFAEDRTQENIRGTRWAGYQTMIEYFDHMQNTRRGKNDETSTAAQRRALRAVTGGSAGDKLRALDAFAVN